MNLVERLRDYRGEQCIHPEPICTEAADRIEALEAELSATKTRLADLADDWRDRGLKIEKLQAELANDHEGRPMTYWGGKEALEAEPVITNVEAWHNQRPNNPDRQQFELEFDEIRYDQSQNKWELYLAGKLMYWLSLDHKLMPGDVVRFTGFKGVMGGRLE